MSVDDVDLDTQLRNLTYKIEYMIGRVRKYCAYRVDLFRDMNNERSLFVHTSEMEILAGNLSDVISSFDPSYGIVADMTSEVSDVLYFPKRELSADLTLERHANKLGELSARIRKICRLAKIIKFKLSKVNEINELFMTKCPECMLETKEGSQEDLKSIDVDHYVCVIEQQIDELVVKLDIFQKNFVINEQNEKCVFAFELGQVSVIIHELFEAESEGRARSGSPGALYGWIYESLKTVSEETLEVLAIKKFVDEADKIDLEKTFDNLWTTLNNIRKELSNIENIYNDNLNINTELLINFLADAQNICADISTQVRDLKKIDLQLRPPLRDMKWALNVDDALKKLDARLSSVTSANNLIKDNLEAVEKVVHGWTVRYAQK